MTSSERPSPDPFLKKRRSQLYRGGGNSRNALESSHSLNYRAWRIPAVPSRGMPGNALRAFSGNFPEFLPESPSRTGGMAQIGSCDNTLLRTVLRRLARVL